MTTPATNPTARQALNYLLEALVESNSVHLKPIAADASKSVAINFAKLIVADLDELDRRVAADAAAVKEDAAKKAMADAAAALVRADR